MAQFTLPALPYANNALEPHISQQTIEFHYGKHHQTYVDNLNKLIVGTEFEGKTLEQIIKSATGGIFNNAAQVFNHTFYWNCLTPNGSLLPNGKLKEAINAEFGSFDMFKEKFTAAAVGLFGSGWAWLVVNSAGKLEIVQTSNAANPMTEDKTLLLTCDVWEHAYYLDKQNRRPAYLESFWQIVDWQKVNERF
ncbi:MAG: superoxide dismutase [Bacteroidales bacterium]|jgi:Fe-Mn family superoxide dismutase|nr:superoxide dismutase [Bacteroidales bacterium]